MSSKILINAVDPEECRIAKVTNSKLEEFHIESASREITHGNIYKGVITRIEPGLQSVFVDYGAERHGFLQKSEIHSDYFQDNDSGDPNIKNLVHKGQELIVQVIKDPTNKKGAMLTTYVSLPGRYVVLMPGSHNRGISRKIEEESERKRLKKIIESLKLPDGFGIIIRTAGVGCSKTMIDKDMRYLLRLWKTIKKKGIEEKAPALLYKEQSLALRAIRDYFTSDVGEILIDNATVYQGIKEFIQIVAPRNTRIVKLYKGEKPIFTKYELENQIDTIFRNRVKLKSGGSIVIDQTEALVAIDVNSGKATKKSIEQTAFQTNMEAAEEITRQLRLRDLGGLIVIDFIDMKDAKHKQEVEKAVKAGLKADKARSKVGKISKFGLMEMTRQRIRPSIEFGSYTTCNHCKGRGLIPSTETLGLRFLRKLSLETLKHETSEVEGVVPVGVAEYLLNKKRQELLDLEKRRNVTIKISGDMLMVPGECRIVGK